jgi:protein-disulfide isomerase
MTHSLVRSVLAAAILLLNQPTVLAADQRTEDEIKQLVLEAILENPEIIADALQRLQELEAERQEDQLSGVLDENWSLLSDASNAAVIGNPDGDVTIVEFFDYNCPYCRRVKPEISALREQDGDIRFVYREWPILGEGSVFAARAALASRQQGKYEDFHWALMEMTGRAERATVLQVAEEVGLDTDQLLSDMEAPAVEDHIAISMQLAQKLGISGTPTFVLRDAVRPGLVSADELAEEVARLRAQDE